MDLLDSFISEITTNFEPKDEAYASLIINIALTSISTSITTFKALKKAKIKGLKNTFKTVKKDPLFIKYAEEFIDFLDFSNSTFSAAEGLLKFNENNLEEYINNLLTNNNIKKISKDNQYLMNFRNKKLQEKWDANAYLNVASTTTDILSAIAAYTSLAGTASAAIPFASIALGVLLIVFSTLNIIFNVDSGNGYTVHENWHDHGLNDWRFQMRNNRDNLVKIALDHSNGFKDNIQWTVTDGWFTFPELYIKNLNNQKETFLSPGTSFNFGNKIQYKGKSWKN